MTSRMSDEPLAVPLYLACTKAAQSEPQRPAENSWNKGPLFVVSSIKYFGLQSDEWGYEQVTPPGYRREKMAFRKLHTTHWKSFTLVERLFALVGLLAGAWGVYAAVTFYLLITNRPLPPPEDWLLLGLCELALLAYGVWMAITGNGRLAWGLAWITVAVVYPLAFLFAYTMCPGGRPLALVALILLPATQAYVAAAPLIRRKLGWHRSCEAAEPDSRRPSQLKPGDGTVPPSTAITQRFRRQPVPAVRSAAAATIQHMCLGLVLFVVVMAARGCYSDGPPPTLQEISDATRIIFPKGTIVKEGLYDSAGHGCAVIAKMGIGRRHADELVRSVLATANKAGEDQVTTSRDRSLGISNNMQTYWSSSPSWWNPDSADNFEALRIEYVARNDGDGAGDGGSLVMLIDLGHDPAVVWLYCLF